MTHSGVTAWSGHKLKPLLNGLTSEHMRHLFHGYKGSVPSAGGELLAVLVVVEFNNAFYTYISCNIQRLYMMECNWLQEIWTYFYFARGMKTKKTIGKP